MSTETPALSTEAARTLIALGSPLSWDLLAAVCPQHGLALWTTVNYLPKTLMAGDARDYLFPGWREAGQSNRRCWAAGAHLDRLFEPRVVPDGFAVVRRSAGTDLLVYVAAHATGLHLLRETQDNVTSTDAYTCDGVIAYPGREQAEAAYEEVVRDRDPWGHGPETRRAVWTESDVPGVMDAYAAHQDREV